MRREDVPGRWGRCEPPLDALEIDGPFEKVTLPGVGHFIQREAPVEVASRLAVHIE